MITIAEPPRSLMAREALSCPETIATLLAEAPPVLDRVVAACRARPPAFVLTVARGSSDHAATFGRYALETITGLPTASALPAVVTQYAAPVRYGNALAIGVSQSGASPDLAAVMGWARAGCATTLAMVNVLPSALSDTAEFALDLAAGPERAVAATKSYIAQMTAFLMLAARLAEDRALDRALATLPDRLAEALAMDWSAAIPALAADSALFVTARGLGLGVAAEWALKLKEVTGKFAEALSPADLAHGPVALIRRGMAVLVLASGDATLSGTLERCQSLKGMGARLIIASDNAEALALSDVPLRLPAAGHPALIPVLAAAAFYPMVAQLAAARGHNPDQPPHLTKVTSTR